MKPYLLLLVTFLTLLFSACKKNDPIDDNHQHNPNDTTGHHNPDTTINTGTQHLNWYKQSLYVQYAADGVTEAYKMVSTFDAQGKTTSQKNYNQGQLSWQTRDYTYTGSEVTYYTDTYTGGALTNMQKTKATNYKYWSDFGTVISYKPDGVTEAYKQTSTFDGQGRRNGIQVWQNGVLSSEVKDYVYSGNEFTCNSLGYTNGSVSSTTKLKYSSYKDFLRLNFYVQYAPNGVTEGYRQETTYDGSERKIGTKTYMNGTLVNETADYVYNGTEVIYYAYNITNGVRGTGSKIKEVYFNL